MRELTILGKKIHDALIDFQNRHEEIWYSNLCGACAVGSAFLVRKAKERLGIRIRFVACDSHAWTEYNDTIYDITAKQFGIDEKVLVLPVSKIHTISEPYLRIDYESRGRRTLKEVEATWPDEQNPRLYRISMPVIGKPVITYRKIKE